MQFTLSLCAFLAPALVSSMAMPWAGPEPTLVAPQVDNWSPAPTSPPQLGDGFPELFRRANDDNTCGYINGVYTSSLTCRNTDYVCATNALNSAHGCCDPSSLSACTIFTSCVPSSKLASCTSSASCASNNYIAKCTNAAQPYCYQWLYLYNSDSTTMTEHGCFSTEFTVSVERTYSGAASSGTSPAISTRTSTPSSARVTSTPVSTNTGGSADASTSTGPGISSTSVSNTSVTPTPVPAKKSNIGVIVGGAVGGLAIIGAIIFGAIFMLLRNRKNKNNDTTANANATQNTQQPEFNPQPGQPGYPQGPGNTMSFYQPQDNKHNYIQTQQPLGTPGSEMGMHQGQNPYSPPLSPVPQYTAPMAMGSLQAPAEVGGTPIQPPQQGHHMSSEGKPVYEAP